MDKENKKLYRSKSDLILTGVCGGLAKYFNIDSTLVRLIFILLSLGGGGGILIYIFLSFLMPKEPGKEEKAEKEEKSELVKGKGKFIGILLIFIGLVFLFDRMMPWGWMRWDLFWPGLLVVMGLYIIMK